MGSVPKPPKGHFNVLYFASAGTFTGQEHEALPAPLALGALFDALEERHPGIRDRVLSFCLVTVNLDYVDVPSSSSYGVDESNKNKNENENENEQKKVIAIQEGDEVAIIPPVSSG